jgi:hypothetical protein
MSSSETEENAAVEFTLSEDEFVAADLTASRLASDNRLRLWLKLGAIWGVGALLCVGAYAFVLSDAALLKCRHHTGRVVAVLTQRWRFSQVVPTSDCHAFAARAPAVMFYVRRPSVRANFACDEVSGKKSGYFLASRSLG